MKVLEEPRAVREYKFRCRQSKCQALVQATEDEGRFVSDQRDGDCYVFKCPRCGYENYVDARQR